MIAKKVISVTLCMALATTFLFAVSGCGRMRSKKTSFEIGKEYFMASEYPKAMIRFESWIQENPNTPEALEAHAMLVIIYHDDETRKNLYDAELKRVQSIGDPAPRAIIKLLEDNPVIDSRLRNSAKSVLVDMGQPAVKPLMQAMRGTNPRIRKFSQETLSEMGPTAVEALIAVLDDPDAYVRARAIESLTEIGDRRSIEAIKKKLNDPSKLVQVEAAAALSKMGEMHSTDTIISALNDADAVTRRAAAKAASEISINLPVGPIIKAANDEDPEVRDYAVETLGRLRSPEAIQPLLKIMNLDAVDKVKNSAAKALEKIGTPAVEPLIQLLGSTKDVETLIRIVQTLGDIGDKSAVKPMERIYNQASNPLLKNETAKALNKIPD